MRYELAIDSMHCERCAGGIERYLRDQPDVESAVVDFEVETGWIEVDDPADVDAIVEAVEAMGYDVSVHR